jgi:hypothetical protein
MELLRWVSKGGLPPVVPPDPEPEPEPDDD